MKPPYIALAILFLCPIWMLAQTNVVGTNHIDLTPPAAISGGGTLLLFIIPVLVPLVIALGKYFVPKIPTVLLPILAPAIGALIDWLSSFATGAEPNPIMASLLGTAGTGMREILDQVRQRIKPDEE